MTRDSGLYKSQIFNHYTPNVPPNSKFEISHLPQSHSVPELWILELEFGVEYLRKSKGTLCVCVCVCGGAEEAKLCRVSHYRIVDPKISAKN